jgi:drug/metabolite transporter (DMT)-like permease
MTAAATSARRNRRGIAAMLSAAAVFTVMDTGLKVLSPHYPAVQVVALRSLSSLPLVVAYVAWRGGLTTILRVRWALHLLRGVLGVAILTTFTLALRRLPLAEAYAIFFVAPAFITALSGLVLKERVDGTRWAAIGVGLLGVLVVLRPTGEGVLTVAGLGALFSAAGYAVIAVLVRILGRTDSGESLVLWQMAIMSAGAGLLAAPGWIPLRLEHGAVLAGVAVSGFLGQIAITEAFRDSEVSVVAPFEYTALAWGVAVDWLLWRTLPDRYTMAGASLIVCSGLYLMRREARAPADAAAVC